MLKACVTFPSVCLGRSANAKYSLVLQNITNSGLRTSTGSYNPAVLSFKPIHVNTPLNLAPVEEPSFVF